MASKGDVPAYEPMLAAYHRGFSAELRSMIDALPMAEGQSVLDMACGDGVYSPWLAERVGRRGRVVAIDLVPEYLELAKSEASNSPLAEVIEFAAAPIESLPFAADTFDLAWCAQSFYSLPDPVDALKHLLRVTKPGGVVAVLEGDTLHHVILPWPIEVELSVRAAELQALADDSDKPRKFYVGRSLRRVFREAGLCDVVTQTFASDRAAPLGLDERTFLGEYLSQLSERISPYLNASTRKKFRPLVDPESASYLLDDPDLTATCIDHLVWGRKP
jgi:ubiquinone/menaquinone biosynthesis C-methylase UbiE